MTDADDANQTQSTPHKTPNTLMHTNQHIHTTATKPNHAHVDACV
jgi:hypothetical protein